MRSSLAALIFMLERDRERERCTVQGSHTQTHTQYTHTKIKTGEGSPFLLHYILVFTFISLKTPHFLSPQVSGEKNKAVGLFPCTFKGRSFRTMLRKRTRSHQKDQHMNNSIPNSISETYFHSDISTQKQKNNSFSKAPGLFVGFNPKSSDSDSVRSPTSPLDFRVFSSLGNPFRCPKVQNEGCLKSWDCSKVGLSIIDSLDNENKQAGNVNRLSENKNILFGRQVSIRCPDSCSHDKPKSLPKDVAVFSKPANVVRKGSSNVVFEIGEGPYEKEPNGAFRSCSMDDSRRFGSYLANFGNRKSRFGSGNLVSENLMKSNPTPLESGFITASEIELSEDYTCVITHGPNPKVTHIYGDCILECSKDEKIGFVKKNEDDKGSYPLDDFLKFCYSCHKKLDGEDIYMYRGEKAFCSYSCRSLEIENDEKMENTNCDTSSEASEASGSSLFITTAYAGK